MKTNQIIGCIETLLKCMMLVASRFIFHVV